MAREQRSDRRGNTRDTRDNLRGNRDNLRGNRDNLRGNRETPYRRGRRKRCRFCRGKCPRKVDSINYKNIELLRNFMTDRGKILPRRVSGNCAKRQRQVTRAIKRARDIALLPFTTQQ